MEVYSKPPRNCDELIKILRNRKLIIPEEEEVEVKSHIRAKGYFRLSGYFGPLQNGSDEEFDEGTYFNDILRLYEFDYELRKLSLDAVQQIEVELRARMTDIYSMAYTSTWYLDETLFKDSKEWIDIKTCKIESGELVERIERVEISSYKRLQEEIIRNLEKIDNHDYLKEFKAKYSPESMVPSWMVMESISFGKLSLLLLLLKNSSEKKKLADHFGAVTSDILVSWIHGLTVLRNISAHHSRLWNKKIKDIVMPTRERHKFINMVPEDNLRRYYGISSCLLKMFKTINPDYKNRFVNDLLNLVNQYGIDITAMGFPEDFNENEIWQGSV